MAMYKLTGQYLAEVFPSVRHAIPMEAANGRTGNAGGLHEERWGWRAGQLVATISDSLGKHGCGYVGHLSP